MKFIKTQDHNSIIPFYRENSLEVSDNIVSEDGAVASFVLQNDNKITAAATLSHRLGIYILDYIAVDVSLRRDGVGAKILGEILKEARLLGADKVYLTAKTPGFFKSQGFYEGSPKGLDMNADCVGCPEFDNGCTKLPMVIDLK